MTEEIGLDPVAKLAAEVRKTAASLNRAEAGHLVAIYYRWQEHRIALGNQVSSLQRAEKPIEVLAHFYAQMQLLEKQAQATLGEWASSRAEGEWALAQKGIGPVLAAGLSSHIDITRAQTAGAIWRFAGLDNSLVWVSREKSREQVGTFKAADATVNAAAGEWWVDSPEVRDLIEQLAEKNSRHSWKLALNALTEAGTITPTSLSAALSRRPYNADLKVLCWKIGDSFVKVSGREGAYYGQLYRERKTLEVQRNEAGMFADQAARSLASRRIQDAALRKTYEAGKLPPGRLDLRARRYAVKLFLSHWHDVAYRDHYGQAPPVPYPIAHLGHTHYISPPPSK